jgi:hypothetical protein
MDDPEGSPIARVINPFKAEGRNILVDGDMEMSGVAAWAVGNSATLTKQTGSPFAGLQSLRVARNGVDNPSARQTILSAGKVYRVQGRARGDGAGTAIPQLIETSARWTGTNSASWQSFDVTFIATGTVLVLANITNSGTSWVEWDSVTVQQINMPSSVPQLPPNLLVDGDMEATDTSAWTGSTNAVLTKQTASPVFGYRYLRIAHGGTINPQAAQTILEIGKVYRATGFVRSDGNVTPRLTDGVAAVFTGTTSTNWQPVDVIFRAAGTSFNLNTLNNSTLGHYAEFDNIRVFEDTVIIPGNRIQDGDMEVPGIAWWTAGNSATLTKEIGTPHGGSQVIRVARNGVNDPFFRQLTLIIGKTYRIRGYARSDGSASPRVSAASGAAIWNGTTSTDWQYFDFSYLSPSTSVLFLSVTSTGTQYTEWDDILIEEIPPMTGTHSGAIPGRATGRRVKRGTFYDGSNDVTLMYTPELNSLVTPGEISAIVLCEFPTAVLTDGTVRRLLRLERGGAGDTFTIYRAGGNNQITFIATTGEATTIKTINVTADLSGMLMLSLVMSKSGDFVKAYVRDKQVGTTQTGLGAVPTQNLLASVTAIGAGTSAGVQPMSGVIHQVHLYDRALDAEEIASAWRKAQG